MAKKTKKKGGRRRKATPAQLRALAKGRRSLKRFKKKRVGVARTGKRRRPHRIHVRTVSEGRSSGRRRSGHRKSPKRVAAGRKAARTRKRHRMHAAAAAAPKNRRSKRRSKRRAGSRTAGHRKSPKRVAAARKAARTRKRNKAAARRERSYQRKHGRKHARRMKRHSYAGPEHDYRSDVPAEESRRSRRGRRRHGWRRNPIPNPIPNPITGAGEFIAAALGGGFGYVLASAADRWAATHALTGTTGSLQDQPAAGQIYNSESIDLPIWSNMMRLGVAAAAVVVPLVVSEATQGAPRAFLQVMGFGALARTVGKAIDDLIAQSMPSTQIVQQLYAPEQAAANRLSQATGQTLSAAAPNTFAGIPRRMVGAAPRALPAPRQGMAPMGARQPQPVARQAQQQHRTMGAVSAPTAFMANGTWTFTDSGLNYQYVPANGGWAAIDNGGNAYWWTGPAPVLAPSTNTQPPLPPFVSDAGAGADMPTLLSPPYNIYAACGDCSDFPIAASLPNGSIFPQPGCEPVAPIALGPNGPTPPTPCPVPPPMSGGGGNGGGGGQPGLPNASLTPPVSTTTALPTAPMPPLPIPMTQPAPPMMTRSGGAPGPSVSPTPPAPPLFVTPR